MKTLTQLLTIAGFLTGSYTTFHGHRLNQDCRLCNYRGLGWIMSVGVIILADYWEKKEQQKKPENTPQNPYRSYPMRDYSPRDTVWENTSDAGSDSSNDTIKENQENN